MKKIKKLLTIGLAVLLMLCMGISLVGCSKEDFEYVYAPNEFYAVVLDNLGNEYKVDISREKDTVIQQVDCDLEYVACYDTFLSIGLQGLYAKDGTPIASELYLSQFESSEIVDLSIVGTCVMTQSCYIYYLINGNKGNGGPQNDYELNFRFTVTVKADKTLHQYVTINEVEIPYDYFACEMQEVSGDYYDLSSITKILSDRETDDYQYGVLIESYNGSERKTYDSLIRNHKTQGESIYETEQYHYIAPDDRREIYQYYLLKGENGYLLNETDGVFSCATFGKHGNSDWMDYSPSHLDLLKKDTSLTYNVAEQNGYTYLSISGEYNDYPNRLEYYNMSCEIIYVIKDNAIVAWLYTDTATSPEKDGYWRHTRYCIPLDGEIELLDEEVLATICIDKENKE